MKTARSALIGICSRFLAKAKSLPASVLIAPGAGSGIDNGQLDRRLETGPPSNSNLISKRFQLSVAIISPDIGGTKGSPSNSLWTGGFPAAVFVATKYLGPFPLRSQMAYL